MDAVQVYEIGRHRVAISVRDAVGPPTPYTLFLADHIPEMSGETVVDIGTGSGILAIVASLRGAGRVYILDSYATAITVAMENAERNAVRDTFVHLPAGSAMLPLADDETVDMVISNPAQLPLPERERENSPYYAGRDGRSMIDAVIEATPARLAPSGRLLMIHNSLSDLPKSLRLMEAQGLEPRVLAERSLKFRPLIDRAWLDEIGGTARGLYTVRDGRAYETLSVIEARRRS